MGGGDEKVGFEGSAVYSLDMDGTEDLLEGDRGNTSIDEMVKECEAGVLDGSCLGDWTGVEMKAASWTS